MLNRRRFVAASGSLAALAVAGFGPRASATPLSAELLTALRESALVYLSPLQDDGRLSHCQAEVWFAYVDDAIYVVTASDAWRALAIDRGLQHTQVWVGDVGQWASSDGAYLELPKLRADAAFERDANAQGRVLESMGEKYSAEWPVWGPRFRNGLADGSRVMLRYRPRVA